MDKDQGDVGRGIQRVMLEALAENEAGIASLYRLYADAFASTRPLWIGLAVEEAKHAELLTNLARDLKPGERLFSPTAQALQKVQEITRRVQTASEAVRATGGTEVAVLGFAVALEGDMAEAGFFEVASDDADRFRHVATILLTHTRRHRDTVQARLNRACPPSPAR